MKKLCSFLLVVSILFAGYMIVLKPIYQSIDLPENMYITYKDVEDANNSSDYAPCVKFNLSNVPVDIKDINSAKLDIKLFGIFPLKSINVKLLNDVEVYVGGQTVGFNLNSEGVIVVGSNAIFTENGQVEPIKNSNIQDGDAILAINDKEITSISEIDRILNQNEKTEEVSLKILRNGDIITTKITPALDMYSNRYKLGLWVKNNASGVGTLTYVKKSTGRFGAVGHQLIDSSIAENFHISQGEMYLCNFLGIKKGEKNNPGEIKASMKLSDDAIGLADTNCEYGVYGNILNNSKLNNDFVANLGGRLATKPGNAKIYTTLDTGEVECFDIKIIKTNQQSSVSDKSIVFKVVDEDLIKRTGGIIQGMSGSPIVQNGKLVGAVTHVFLNDPTKGYGVYIDWMIDN